MHAIRLSAVTKTYGTHVAVRDLSLAVPRGCIYGFIGPNGSGKTTTLRMILRILLPDSGEIEVLGQASASASNDRLGYLPEERGLYKKMTVERLLTYYGEIKGLQRATARRAAREWLERLDLSSWAEKKIEALSKGMAQKVQFIATVLHGPELLILDEPFSGLDPVNQEVLREAVLSLARQGTTVLFSTHDMPVAERMCDFICMIFRGEKVLDGTLAGIQERYGSDTVRVRAEGARTILANHPAVEALTDLGQEQEARLRQGADAQQVLAALAGRARVERFEIAHPSLHDIFVRIAGPEARETLKGAAPGGGGTSGAGTRGAAAQAGAGPEETRRA